MDMATQRGNEGGSEVYQSSHKYDCGVTSERYHNHSKGLIHTCMIKYMSTFLNGISENFHQNAVMSI